MRSLDALEAITDMEVGGLEARRGLVDDVAVAGDDVLAVGDALVDQLLGLRVVRRTAGALEELLGGRQQVVGLLADLVELLGEGEHAAAQIGQTRRVVNHFSVNTHDESPLSVGGLKKDPRLRCCYWN